MAWQKIQGHDAARHQLFTAFRRGRLAHAFLFTGPVGVGKHLFATEFAKALLCENPPAELTACDRCQACAQVMAGTHPDFYTARKPETKHELPIDVIRVFCQQLGLKPSRGKRSVGIVEDADDLNEESANCFLKTLEEPPPGSVLILLTSTTEGQLSTILSRCQVVRFHPLPPLAVATVLATHDITDSTQVQRLVRLANGCPGQALALNDDALWAFRETMLATMTSPRPDSVTVAERWFKFVEEVGKESAAQRARASLVIRMVMDALQIGLRLALGDESVATNSEIETLRRFAVQHGPDQLATWLEDCAEADYLIDRKVQLILVIESLSDKLCRTAS